MRDEFTPIGRFAASDPFDVKSTVAVGANYGSETTPQKPGAVYFAIDDDAVGMDYVVAVEFRDHLTKVLDEIKARAPKNSDIIRAIPDGERFFIADTTQTNPWFRTSSGIVNRYGGTFAESEFLNFNSAFFTITKEETN